MSRLSLKNNNAPAAVAAPNVLRPGRHVPQRRLHVLESPRLFLTTIGVLILVLLVWASLAPIDRVVRVEGVVIPARHSQQIQHLEGGIIASIDTTDGAVVHRGDLLMTIDGTTANADMKEMQDKWDAARARVVRLQAETQGADQLKFPPDLARLPVAAAEQSLFLSLKQKLDHEIAVQQSTIRQRNDDIAQAKQQEASLASELAIAQQRQTMEETMASQGATSKMEVLNAQSQVQRLKTERGLAEDSIPKFQAAITEEQARIQAMQSDFVSHAHDELLTAMQDSDRFQQGISTTTDRLKRTEIRAPVDGIINHVNVSTVGGVIKPGETLIELTPDTKEILIEAKAVPRDRGYLRAGLDARIRVSTYDSGELGLLDGHVTEVGADSIEDAHGNATYQVNVLVKSLPTSYEGHDIIPGMTVTADIVTGHRSVLAYLLSPVTRFTYNMFRDPR